MDTTQLDTALAAMQSSANALATDVTAQGKTAASLQAAQAADQAAQQKVTSDTADLQSKADAVVAAIVGLGLKVNPPSA